MKALFVNDRRKGMFIGAYLPQWATAYLSLYTLTKGITKTAVLKTIVEAWIMQQKEQDSEEALINQLINIINTSWEVSRVVTPEVTYREYCQKVKEELISKGLQKTQVNNVMNKIRY